MLGYQKVLGTTSGSKFPREILEMTQAPTGKRKISGVRENVTILQIHSRGKNHPERETHCERSGYPTGKEKRGSHLGFWHCFAS